MDRYWCREGGGPEIVEHWGAHGVARAAGKTGLIAGVGGVVGIGIVAAEYLHELAHAEKKGEETALRSPRHAVNVSLAHSLAFARTFGELEDVKRPGVKQAAGRLSQTLNAPGNAALKAAFQTRADEGFSAACRASEYVTKLPPGEREAGFTRWMKDNGFGERLDKDVAFAKGVEYQAWIHTSQAKSLGVDASLEEARVQTRLPPPQAFRCAG